MDPHRVAEPSRSLQLGPGFIALSGRNRIAPDRDRTDPTRAARPVRHRLTAAPNGDRHRLDLAVGMMNGPFSSNLHLTTMDGERHLGVVIQAEMAGRRPVLGVRHANGTFATRSPSILGTVSCGRSANRMEDLDEV